MSSRFYPIRLAAGEYLQLDNGISGAQLLTAIFLAHGYVELKPHMVSQARAFKIEKRMLKCIQIDARNLHFGVIQNQYN